jgi:hypothetical protein
MFAVAIGLGQYLVDVMGQVVHHEPFVSPQTLVEYGEGVSQEEPPCHQKFNETEDFPLLARVVHHAFLHLHQILEDFEDIREEAFVRVLAFHFGRDRLH